MFVSHFTGISKGKLVFFGILFLMLICLYGCDADGLDTDKLSAEEAGYGQEFKDVITEVGNACHDLYLGVNAVRYYANLGDKEGKSRVIDQTAGNRNTLRNLSTDSLAALQETAPPNDFIPMHERVVSLLNRVRDVELPINIAQDCLNTYKSMSSLRSIVNARSKVNDLKSHVAVSYTPPRSPIGIDSEGKLSVTFETPIGGFQIAEASPGVSKLVIIVGNKKSYYKKYYYLDRKFVIAYEANGWVQIQNSKDALYVIIERPRVKRK